MTHVWFDCHPNVPVVRPERPLPKRLKVDETWETWIPVSALPKGLNDKAASTLGRVRLSTGKTYRSGQNKAVVPFGNIPGGGPTIAPSGTMVPIAKLTRRPQFRFTGIGRRHLFFSPDQKEGVVEPTTQEQEATSVACVTAIFTNNADDGTASRAVDVVARVRFYSSDWSKSRDILYGVWLSSPCNCTEMEIGAIQELVLLVVDGSTYFSLRDLRVSLNRQYGENYVKVEDVSWFSHVRIKLTDQVSGESTVFTLRLWFDNGWCQVESLPPSHITNAPW